MKKDLIREIAIVFVLSIIAGCIVGGFVGTMTGMFLPFSKKQKERSATCVESTESKLMAVTMRCGALEQEVEMLQIRIDALEYRDRCSSSFTNAASIEVDESSPNGLAIDDLIEETKDNLTK